LIFFVVGETGPEGEEEENFVVDVLIQVINILIF